MKRGDMPASPTGDTTYPSGQVQIGDTGMTIRERFAMSAMQGLLASGKFQVDAELSKEAWAAADDMLYSQELEHTGGGDE